MLESGTTNRRLKVPSDSCWEKACRRLGRDIASGLKEKERLPVYSIQRGGQGQGSWLMGDKWS